MLRDRPLLRGVHGRAVAVRRSPVRRDAARSAFDEQSGFYIARGWVKRALHEYQYVSGTWDEDAGILRDAEATLLEGNTTMSTQQFLAFVYYRESTAGGYDRVIGAGSGGI